MKEARYEEIEHTADWALRVRGATMTELCQVAASAMLAASGARGEGEPSVEYRFHLEAPDRETLLVQWLEEVLFAVDSRQRIPTQIEVRLTASNGLTGSWQEIPLTAIDKPIKAVTFHELCVDETPEGLEATIVFDV